MLIKILSSFKDLDLTTALQAELSIILGVASRTTICIFTKLQIALLKPSKLQELVHLNMKMKKQILQVSSLRC